MKTIKLLLTLLLLTTTLIAKPQAILKLDTLGHTSKIGAGIEGLGKYKADYDNDGTISIKEIDLYITNRVKKLTKGKQKPTTIIPNSIPDFAIGVR
jgi:hypothetical protein